MATTQRSVKTILQKLEQSLNCVDHSLGELSRAMVKTGVETAVIPVKPDDDEGAWREACDMTAQALEELETLKMVLNEALDRLDHLNDEHEKMMARLRQEVI